jgi:serine/threonine protein kinase
MSSSDKNNKKNDDIEIIANRYRVEEKKRGEKGSTYLVSDTKINDQLKCIKVLNVATTNRNELKEIIREENVLSQMENPYIVKYYESFINNDTICIVTEYCDVIISFVFILLLSIL